MLLDPKLPLLYTIGWGGNGLFTMPLKKDGEPTGEPMSYPFGYNAKSAMIPSDKFDCLIFGGHPSTVEVGDLNTAGDLEQSVSKFKIVESPEVVQLARVGRSIYFTREKQLWVWPLDRDWRPVDAPKPIPKISAVGLWEGLHPFLYVVLGEFEPNANPKDSKLAATRLARFKPDAAGQPGQPEFVSERFEGKTIRRIAMDESTGVIYVGF